MVERGKKKPETIGGVAIIFDLANKNPQGRRVQPAEQLPSPHACT